MKLLDTLRLRFATLFQRSQMDAEMEEELRSHIQLRSDDLERSGLAVLFRNRSPHKHGASRRLDRPAGATQSRDQHVHSSHGHYDDCSCFPRGSPAPQRYGTH